jgi:hypothetical protein
MTHDCDRYCSVYSDPKKHGFHIVEATSASIPYAFHIVLLLMELKTGKKWFAVDSGCSCPVPFENHKNTSNMTPYQGHEHEYRAAVGRAKNRERKGY